MEVLGEQIREIRKILKGEETALSRTLSRKCLIRGQWGRL